MEDRDYDRSGYARGDDRDLGDWDAGQQARAGYERDRSGQGGRGNYGYTGQGSGQGWQTHSSGDRQGWEQGDWEADNYDRSGGYNRGMGYTADRKYGRSEQPYRQPRYRQGQYDRSQYGRDRYDRGDYSASGYAPTAFIYEEEYWLVPGPHTGKGPRGYTRSDERIREDVSERLTRHGQIDASDIEVRVQDGEVTLSGTAEDRRQKRLAEDLAEGVPGVRDVHNEVKVRGGFIDKVKDALSPETDTGVTAGTTRTTASNRTAGTTAAREREVH